MHFAVVNGTRYYRRGGGGGDEDGSENALQLGLLEQDKAFTYNRFPKCGSFLYFTRLTYFTESCTT